MGCGASSASGKPKGDKPASGAPGERRVEFAADAAVIDSPKTWQLGPDGKRIYVSKSDSNLKLDGDAPGAADEGEESEEDDVPVAAFGKARNSMWINKKKMGKDGNWEEEDDDEDDPNFVNPHAIFGGGEGAPSPAAAAPAPAPEPIPDAPPPASAEASAPASAE